MASELPKRLDQLCEATGTSLFDLTLHCAFCNFRLTFQELADFHWKSLSLLYRNNQPYAACRVCLTVSAKAEFEKFCRCSVPAENLSDLLQQRLSDISVRCYLCYKLLDCAEKVDLCAGSLKVYLVRQYWRGVCRDCRKK